VVAVNKNEWISVKKSLPPIGKIVECIGARGGKFKGRRVTKLYDGKTVYMQTPDDGYGRDATHWRKLEKEKK
jgi:hypothetical protein